MYGKTTKSKMLGKKMFEIFRELKLPKVNWHVGSNKNFEKILKQMYNNTAAIISYVACKTGIQVLLVILLQK